ncbi:hypothetical protein C7G91_18775 [Acinetobacter nosocomialis]|nr:hypothetical protein C7G64_19070 [Acinetobacter baumannii]PSE20361.1 hypothetical protein C7G68_19090 [Acinetobacter baumannii]PSE65239.1 hypothetical protein C7G78_18965 [Acinetobacter baumannii]PSE76785.1 hypothetical protein C7G91_18775 [Acinetobacter nosocomialis]
MTAFQEDAFCEVAAFFLLLRSMSVFYSTKMKPTATLAAREKSPAMLRASRLGAAALPLGLEELELLLLPSRPV